METSSSAIWKRRVSVVQVIYSELITDQDFSKIDLSDQRDNWIDFENKIFDNYLNNKHKYISLVESYLKSNWSLERLNTLCASILLEAISEFYVFKTPVKVLITESVKTAKNYCDENEYRIVNRVLEDFLKNEAVNT
ncbi:transcription antitermination protein NusB [Mycoplasma haemocanis str. Illinois]|uniref:Transcription antitermination protein NusB n=1 Tax=Mycoplasma haemocanis (strain Illinois) TaxID=1111676 RepID=H6N8D3_MYCHN|nr:transcription antitermination factor NusB [Mycoplasma haemocanis]AEW45905.1 transcription antitermination protein NusB [Mycoplasma haemocanis str. Illinois]